MPLKLVGETGIVNAGAHGTQPGAADAAFTDRGLRAPMRPAAGLAISCPNR